MSNKSIKAKTKTTKPPPPPSPLPTPAPTKREQRAAARSAEQDYQAKKKAERKAQAEAQREKARAAAAEKRAQEKAEKAEQKARAAAEDIDANGTRWIVCPACNAFGVDGRWYGSKITWRCDTCGKACIAADKALGKIKWRDLALPLLDRRIAASDPGMQVRGAIQRIYTVTPLYGTGVNDDAATLLLRDAHPEYTINGVSEGPCATLHLWVEDNGWWGQFTLAPSHRSGYAEIRSAPLNRRFHAVALETLVNYAANLYVSRVVPFLRGWEPSVKNAA